MRCLNGSFDVAVCDGEYRSEADGLQAVNSAFKVTFGAHSMGGGDMLQAFIVGITTMYNFSPKHDSP